MDVKEQFRAQVTSLPKDACLGILHDADGDGVCSAVLIAKALEKLGHTAVFFQDMEKRASLTKKTLEKIKKKKITLLFTTDKALDNDLPMAKELEAYCQLIVFDHHNLDNDITSEKTLLVKPQLFSQIPSSQYPSSKLVYDFFGEIVSLEEYDWLCAAGVISDAAYKTWKTFIDHVHQRHNLPVVEPIFLSDLGKVGGAITTAALYSTKIIPSIVKIVYRSQTHADILHALSKYVDPVRAEIERCVHEFSTKKELYRSETLYWYDISSAYGITSITSTRLSMQEPSMTFIVAQKKGKNLALSLRRQDGKVNCIELVREGIKGIKSATGGGHIPAAGGQAPYAEKENIKKRMLSWLKAP